jgi:hypothetical protein
MAQDLEHHHVHRNKHRLQKFEGMADMATLAVIVVLGIAMLVGLITASGTVTW